MAFQTESLTHALNGVDSRARRRVRHWRVAEWRAEAEGARGCAPPSRSHDPVSAGFAQCVRSGMRWVSRTGTQCLRCRGAPTYCTPVHQAGTERRGSSDRMGDVNTRCMLGRTRRGKKYWAVCGSWSLASWGHPQKIQKIQNYSQGGRGTATLCAAAEMSWVPRAPPPLVDSTRLIFSRAYSLTLAQGPVWIARYGREPACTSRHREDRPHTVGAVA